MAGEENLSMLSLILHVSRTVMIAGILLSIHKRLAYVSDKETPEDLYEDEGLFDVSEDSNGDMTVFWKYSVRPEKFKTAFFDKDTQDRIQERTLIESFSGLIEVKILTRATFESIMVQARVQRDQFILGTEIFPEPRNNRISINPYVESSSVKTGTLAESMKPSKSS